MCMTISIVIKPVESNEQLKLALSIRNKVFVKEQGIDIDIEKDGKDEAAIHVLAFVDGNPVATARLCTSNDEGTIARVAVETEYRGCGIGPQLVQALEDIALSKNLRSLTLEPHVHLETFYSELGYETIPGVGIKVNEHELITMRKML